MRKKHATLILIVISRLPQTKGGLLFGEIRTDSPEEREDMHDYWSEAFGVEALLSNEKRFENMVARCAAAASKCFASQGRRNATL